MRAPSTRAKEDGDRGRSCLARVRLFSCPEQTDEDPLTEGLPKKPR